MVTGVVLMVEGVVSGSVLSVTLPFCYTIILIFGAIYFLLYTILVFTFFSFLYLSLLSLTFVLSAYLHCICTASVVSLIWSRVTKSA